MTLDCDVSYTILAFNWCTSIVQFETMTTTIISQRHSIEQIRCGNECNVYVIGKVEKQYWHYWSNINPDIISAGYVCTLSWKIYVWAKTVIWLVKVIGKKWTSYNWWGGKSKRLPAERSTSTLCPSGKKSD